VRYMPLFCLLMFLTPIRLQMSLEELLALTAALESQSEHPLAGSVLDFAESVISPPDSSTASVPLPAAEVSWSHTQQIISKT